MNVKFVTDFTLEDNGGGAERVDDTVIRALGLEVIKSQDFKPVEDEFYVISNISLLPQYKIDFLAKHCKYIILEHDYKFHQTRQPWRYKECVVPEREMSNKELYKNAVCTFVQTLDHLEVFRRNGIEGEFFNLNCSIWSKSELATLLSNWSEEKRATYAVIDSDNWIKNTKQSVGFCLNMQLDYELVKDSDYNRFLKKLSQYSTLVFFPIARETCCRLIVEAKAMGLNVLTSDNSGAFKSEWYSKSGKELVDYLNEESTNNLKVLKEMIEKEAACVLHL